MTLDVQKHLKCKMTKMEFVIFPKNLSPQYFESQTKQKHHLPPSFLGKN